MKTTFFQYLFHADEPSDENGKLTVFAHYLLKIEGESSETIQPFSSTKSGILNPALKSITPIPDSPLISNLLQMKLQVDKNSAKSLLVILKDEAGVAQKRSTVFAESVTGSYLLLVAIPKPGKFQLSIHLDINGEKILAANVPLELPETARLTDVIQCIFFVHIKKLYFLSIFDFRLICFKNPKESVLYSRLIKYQRLVANSSIKRTAD